MASTKTIEAKLDKLSGDLAKTSWLRLGRKVSRGWKTGTAAEEIAKQREKDTPVLLTVPSHVCRCQGGRGHEGC